MVMIAFYWNDLCSVCITTQTHTHTLTHNTEYVCGPWMEHEHWALSIEHSQTMNEMHWTIHSATQPHPQREWKIRERARHNKLCAASRIGQLDTRIYYGYYYIVALMQRHPHTLSLIRTRSSIMRVIVFRSGEKYSRWFFPTFSRSLARWLLLIFGCCCTILAETLLWAAVAWNIIIFSFQRVPSLLLLQFFIHPVIIAVLFCVYALAFCVCVSTIAPHLLFCICLVPSVFGWTLLSHCYFPASADISAVVPVVVVVVASAAMLVRFNK